MNFPWSVILSEAKNPGTFRSRVSIQAEALRFAQGDNRRK
jgi:hypothetical protein